LFRAGGKAPKVVPIRFGALADFLNALAGIMARGGAKPGTKP
jgi:hypothetical protein